MLRTLLQTGLILVAMAVQGSGATNAAAPAATQVSFDTNTGVWRVVGAKHQLTVNPTNLSWRIETPATGWRGAESRAGDLQVRHDGDRCRQRTTFADGTRVTVDLQNDQWNIEPAIVAASVSKWSFPCDIELMWCCCY